MMNTTTVAMTSSRTSAPSKMPAKSPSMPPGPVTWAVRPGWLCARSRISSTAPGSWDASPVVDRGTTICSARPSADGIGPDIRPATPSTDARARWSPATAARSPAVMPESRTYTTTAGVCSSPKKSGSMRATWVASAPAGRNEALSFLTTSPSMPA
ncbi:hypothetical protein LUW74_24905 [Actinomadura madurae]|nr:hypothetical protein [Actinomadura madurae]URN06236.1 hypothetical protein LUW74_24905 [Actinomadura madurae]